MPGGWKLLKINLNILSCQSRSHITLYSEHKQLERYVNRMGITLSPACIFFPLLFSDDTFANISVGDAGGVAPGLDGSPAGCAEAQPSPAVFQP